MAHGGCACHAALPRHRYYSTAPPPSEANFTVKEHRIYPQVLKGSSIMGEDPQIPSSSIAGGFLDMGSQSPLFSLTIIPSELEEACFQVHPPRSLGSTIAEGIRAVLCASVGAPLFCTPARKGGRVYWIAHGLSPVNERAVRLTGVSGVSGDAVLVDDIEHNLLHSAHFSQGGQTPAKARPPVDAPGTPVSQGGNIQGKSCPPVGHVSGSLVSRSDVESTQAMQRDGSDKCNQSDCSHKRGIHKPSGRLDPLVKRLRGSGCELPPSNDVSRRAGTSELSSVVDVHNKDSKVNSCNSRAQVPSILTFNECANLHPPAPACSHPECWSGSHSLDGIHPHSPNGATSHQPRCADSLPPEVASTHPLESVDLHLMKQPRSHSPDSVNPHLSANDTSHQAVSSDVHTAQDVHRLGCGAEAPDNRLSQRGGAKSQAGAAPREGGQSIDALSIGELQIVFSFLGFSDLSAAAAVSKLWRTSIGEDEPLLKSISIRRRKFKPSIGSRMRVSQPSIGPAAALRTSFFCQTNPLPFVLARAADAGNVPAMVLVAEEMERQGRRPKALDWWKKAARKGDQGSQYRVGEAYYRGDAEWPRDGEEALIWLNRAAKFTTGDDQLSAAAGLLLGYMHLDGEGIAAPDNTEAVRWFRFAAELGNREAEKTLGWLWNTGQF